MQSYLFDIPHDKSRFFTTSQRSQIVDFILKRKHFGAENEESNFGIAKLLQDDVYLAAFPMHEGSEDDINSPRAKLLRSWASVGRMFARQPLDEIRLYYGVKIALYFAWLGFYTYMLIPVTDSIAMNSV